MIRYHLNLQLTTQILLKNIAQSLQKQKFTALPFTRSSSSSSPAPIYSPETIPTESQLKNTTWLRYKYETNIFALRRATIFHYQACTDKLKAEIFFKHLELPDTLYSFYLIVQLHLWMCQVRSMREGPEGRKLRNEIMERMWHDMDVRLNKINVLSSGKRKAILKDLLCHHQCAILSYDEGLLTDDKTLANALWRTLFSKEDVNPEVLELAVKYVRIQINHLRSISSRDWCLDGKFEWAHFPPLIEIKQ